MAAVWQGTAKLCTRAVQCTCCEIQHNVPKVSLAVGTQDGPSAGVTLATALASLFTGRPVRADTAMTGALVIHACGVRPSISDARRLNKMLFED